MSRLAALRSAGRAVRARRATAAPPPQPGPWDPTLTSALYVWCKATGRYTRPQYLWPLLHAAHVARALSIPRIAALEFGVAGGNGLLALERAAEVATELSGTDVEVLGFDTGEGMPPAADPRDAPWLLEPSDLRMDPAALERRLTTAKLVLGPVAETVPRWLGTDAPPVGFVAFDLDYYSSTAEALRLFDAPDGRLLPRVPCYFDDTFGYGWTEFTGVHAAIDEFNDSHAERKIGRILGLRFELPPDEFTEQWHEKLFVMHSFGHPRYAEREGRIAPEYLDAHRLPPE